MTPQEKTSLSRVLVATYGEKMMDHDRLTSLWRVLGREDADTVAMAIDAHIADATEDGYGHRVGQYPPKPADILARIRRLRDEAAETTRREQEDTHRRVRDGSGGRKIPYTIPAEIRKKAPYLPNIRYTWTSDCHECSDSGLASFFAEYNATDDRYIPGRVWLRSEALELPDEQLHKMRRQTAACDCQRGRVRPERQLMTSVWSERQGREVEVTTYPRLEYIRKIAERRRANDGISNVDGAVSGSNHRPGGHRGGAGDAAPAPATEGQTERRDNRVGVTGPQTGSDAGDSRPLTGRAASAKASNAGELATSRPSETNTEVYV